MKNLTPSPWCEGNTDIFKFSEILRNDASALPGFRTKGTSAEIVRAQTFKKGRVGSAMAEQGPVSLKKRSVSSLNLNVLSHALSQPDITGK